MFAALVFDREPLTLTWPSFFGALMSWTQSFGGFAAVAILFWSIAYALSKDKGPREGGGRKAIRACFIGGALLSAVAYLTTAALFVPDVVAYAGSEDGMVPPPPIWRIYAIMIAWTTAGAAAIFAVLAPIVLDFPRISLRRIVAIARLSLKEAVRRKVLWGFVSLLLVVLFGSWFLSTKPEDEVRNYVTVVSIAKALLLVFAGLLIASFGIPDDIRQQTIHTVLTKPVEKFEVFLGRFLGYTALMTAVLAVIAGLGLLYVLRGVGEEARAESLKARVPYYGFLEFDGTKDRKAGENVGREWEYRSYIFGPVPNQPTQYAVWGFKDLSSSLTNRATARAEFTFDIYRTTKGKEGEGVFCSFFVESWRFDSTNPAVKAKYDERRQALARDPATKDKLVADPSYIDKTLAEEFGYYEILSKEIKDYHTLSVEFPTGVVKNALETSPELEKLRQQMDLKEQERQAKEGLPVYGLPNIRVRVRCDSRTQFVGMAKHDLYLRLDDPDAGQDTLRFCVNFLKGSFGIWLWLALVTGLSVALSTYLSGVITLITTVVLFVLGFFRDYIQDLATGRVAGGGPLEAAYRLLKRPGGESLAVPLEETTAVKVSTGFDKLFGWLLQRVMEMIPDVARFSFTDFVAEGVAISGGQMFMAFLIMLGYVVPWAILAFYLLRWREIAGNT